MVSVPTPLLADCLYSCTVAMSNNLYLRCRQVRKLVDWCEMLHIEGRSELYFNDDCVNSIQHRTRVTRLRVGTTIESNKENQLFSQGYNWKLVNLQPKGHVLGIFLCDSQVRAVITRQFHVLPGITSPLYRQFPSLCWNLLPIPYFLRDYENNS